jgi:hypothetical protein
MDTETYLDNLSNGLLHLQEMIANIDGSGLDREKKEEALKILNEKYMKIHSVFECVLLKYIS